MTERRHASTRTGSIIGGLFWSAVALVLLLESRVEPATRVLTSTDRADSPVQDGKTTPSVGTVAPDQVRGMNASLVTPALAGDLRERPPSSLHISRRRIGIVLLLVALAVVAGILTVNAVTSGEHSYPAVVTTAKVYDLNFPVAGKVTDLSVRVGQTVHSGQVLARQDTSALLNDLVSAEGVLQADRQILAQDQSPQLTGAQQEQDALQVKQAQEALSNAQSALASDQAVGQAALLSARAAVAGDQLLVASDQARYAQACPSGPVPPDPSLSGAQFQAAQTQYGRCQDLQLQMNKDSTTLSQDQSHISVVQTQSQAQIAQAQATVNSAQATLALASYQQTVQASPANQAVTAQAEAAVYEAQQEVTQAQQNLQAAALLAPDNGIVAEVYGAVGEYLGPDGVHQYLAPAALPAAQSPGFQLFPTQTAPSGVGSSTNGNEPLIEVVGGQQQAMAQIPENEIRGFRVGAKVHAAFPALGTTATGVVSTVVLNPTRTSGDVTYDVVITLDRPIAELLPGMSATVRR